jgi:hypothetical protein
MAYCDCVNISTKLFVESLVDRLEREYRYERDEIMAAVHVLSDQQLGEPQCWPGVH